MNSVYYQLLVITTRFRRFCQPQQKCSIDCKTIKRGRRAILFLITLILAVAVSSCEKGFYNGRAVTGEATDISCRYATLSGSTSSPDKGISYIEYSTNSKFEDTEDDFVETLLPDNIGSDGIIKMKTALLKPETTYYYRCAHLPSLDKELVLGDVKTFKTLPVSSMIKTDDVTDISYNGATLNATINLNNCYIKETEYQGAHFILEDSEWSYDYIGTISGNTCSYRVSSLQPNKVYKVTTYVAFRGYDQFYYGETKRFSTQAVKASIILDDVVDVTELKSAISGRVDIESQGAVPSSTFLYYSQTAKTLNALRNSGMSAPLSLDQTNYSFSTTLKDLTPGVTYYYVVVSTICGAEVASEIKSFTTLSPQVVLSANPATNITELRGTLNGKLSVNSIEELSKSVYFYYSDRETTPTALKNRGTRVSSTLSADGTFQCSLSGLSSNTKYYYIASASLSGQEYTSAIETLSTADCTINYTVLSPSSAMDEIGLETASLRGRLTVSSIEDAGYTDFCFYYSESATTKQDLISKGIKIDGWSVRPNDAYVYFTLSGLKQRTTYYYMICVKVWDKEYYGILNSFTTKGLSSGTKVDMGGSVYWASCNVGASKPEGKGDRYAWGETSSKTDYQWSTYSLCSGTGGVKSKMTKYCTDSSYGTVDNKTNLDLEDDVAHIKLGGKWRMPTEAEWAELKNSANVIETTLNGVNGYLVFSKNTGNSIFLPYGVGDTRCYYWTSSLSTSSPNCAKVGENSGSIWAQYRYVGCTVRPVCEY